MIIINDKSLGVLGWLSEPFGSDLVQRAFVAGVIVACLCAVVGTWVVLRGSAFLGDAMSHGVLPGVAMASLVGGNIFVGALLAALAMAYGVSSISGTSRLSADTSIGLLLVGMLALGVIMVSHSQTYAVDLTGFLFGDVLAVRTTDIAVLACALVLTTVAAYMGRRAFVAATFDPHKAATLGLRPDLASAALTVLIAVAIVASFRVVGTLLVFGLLIAPPAAAMIWADTITRIMALAATFGVVSVGIGLLISWHAATAGGATIAVVAVAIFFGSLAAAALRRRAVRLSATALVAISACVAGCTGGAGGVEEAPPVDPEESAEPVTRLVMVDPGTGETAVYDVLDETETALGTFGPVENLSGDGRFGYLHTHDRLVTVDAGAWAVDHGDHNHYYVAPPAVARTTELRGIAQAAPHSNGLVVVTATGQLQALDEKESVRELPGECQDANGIAVLGKVVIVGCRNGAIRIDVGGAEPAVTPIPFPAAGPAAAPGRLQHRHRDDVLAAAAGDEVWVLDSGPRTWSPVPVAGAVAANTGDDGEVLVLTRDGTLRAIDTQAGTETAHLQLFAHGISDEPAIEVDSDRAYVNDAAGRVVYEIDYAEGLRLARTLRTEVRPGLMVEAGR